jgi:hypothetical protein
MKHIHDYDVMDTFFTKSVSVWNEKQMYLFVLESQM